MGAGEPYMYNAVSSHGAPSSHFDPKAISRASLTPKPERPKQDGPLVSFNKHPDSYLILPNRSSNAVPMSRSMRKRIVQTRIVVLIFRILQLLGAMGVLACMIMVTEVPDVTVWIMRIPPGVCLLHCVYGAYHLSRRATGRTPASSASYMLFATTFDLAIIPFYVFSALVSSSQYKLSLQGPGAALPEDAIGPEGQWNSRFAAGQAVIPTLSGTVFLCATIAGGLHLITFALSTWLAVTFRRISRLPPDLNPLEDNLTSRHKRNKSSVSVSTIAEQRLTEPLETKRHSGAPYEPLARPPTIPFLQTRTSSTDSFATYDSRLDLPSRQYQVPPSNSARSSVADLKRASQAGPPTPPKRSSHMESPSRELLNPYARSSVADFKRNSQADSGPSPSKRASYVESPGREILNPFTNKIGTIKDPWYAANSISSSTRRPTTSPRKAAYEPVHQQQEDDDDDDDDIFSQGPSNSTFNPLGSHPPTPTSYRRQQSVLSEISLNRSGDLADQRLEPVKAKGYGDLRAGTPPILVGGGRQVSSGNDFSGTGTFRVFNRRDVSGRVAEEGRGGAAPGGWGAKMRKISGL